MKNKTDDLRIINTQELVSPREIIDSISPSEKGFATIINARNQIKNILNKSINKFMIVVGPCSIHDVEAAKEYAIRLKNLSSSLSSNCLLVMRVYFEKPRTVIGWKGLINDPDLDGSFKINKGIRIARKLLIDLAEMEIPCGHEFLDLVSPQYVSDLISWGAIGARTTESQSQPMAAQADVAPEPDIQWQEFTIKSGDTLSTLFRKAGFNDGLMLSVIHGDGEADKLQRQHAPTPTRLTPPQLATPPAYPPKFSVSCCSAFSSTATADCATSPARSERGRGSIGARSLWRTATPEASSVG